jgi:hypothetical protein
LHRDIIEHPPDRSDSVGSSSSAKSIVYLR